MREARLTSRIKNVPWLHALILLLTLSTHAVIQASGMIIDDLSEPLEDGARCDSTAVRRANSATLNGLFDELANTTFFRLFRVGLDGHCPLTSSNSPPSAAASVAAALSEEPSCGAPPLDPWTATVEASTTAATSKCHVETVAERPSFLSMMNGNNMNGISSPVDLTISSSEKLTTVDAPDVDPASCADDETSVPSFWFDMCDGLVSPDVEGDRHHDTDGWINLQLNPERYTGYNGSQVWSYMYEKACDFDETCHEERVLHRLLSGMHAAVNTHIALSFVDPGDKSKAWLPSPKKFMESVGSHPERLRNLNFAFVVMLRALRKASPMLSKLSFAVGSLEEDARTSYLVRNLLGSHLLKSCSNVFDAFDETLMFQGPNASELKRRFKGAFRNISSIMNCVKCQKCRLHGKLQLAGLGTALKILLVPENSVADMTLTREELVAFFNTLHKFSNAIASVDRLSEMYLTQKAAPTAEIDLEATSFATSGASRKGLLGVDPRDALDRVVARILEAAESGLFTAREEEELLRASIPHDAAPGILLPHLAAHVHNLERFAALSRAVVLGTAGAISDRVVVVGSGLAGTSAVLTLLDAGVPVLLIEKQAYLGGNSVYAASGMNAVDEASRALGDSVDAFASDIAKSSGLGPAHASNKLVRALVEDAESALHWAESRSGVKFSRLGRLGGHSYPRTHRPDGKSMAGAQLLYSMHRALTAHEQSGLLEIRKSTSLVRLSSTGVYVSESAQRIGAPGSEEFVPAQTVILATGGFAASEELVPSNLTRFGTTNGRFAVGDGLRLARRDLKAGAVDLDKVQLHPTAFVVPQRAGDGAASEGHGDEVDSRLLGAQPLCAEILRGTGGLLLDKRGRRFCDELGTRSYVSGRMLELGQSDYFILLSEVSARETDHYVPGYVRRGLMERHDSLESAAKAMNVSLSELQSELASYAGLGESNAADAFGKTQFPHASSYRASSGEWFLGRVQPARHYCMGGITVDEFGRVLSESGQVIPGLFGAGEVTGGLHGSNRLGGNGMTEGLVFGKRVAAYVIQNRAVAAAQPVHAARAAPELKKAEASTRMISLKELAQHNHAKDCWVAIDGVVYDFTSFLSEHPAGPEAILDYAGADATELYDSIHTRAFLEDIARVGKLE